MEIAYHNMNSHEIQRFMLFLKQKPGRFYAVKPCVLQDFIGTEAVIHHIVNHGFKKCTKFYFKFNLYWWLKLVKHSVLRRFNT